MAEDVFSETVECKENKISNCTSATRIKCILCALNQSNKMNMEMESIIHNIFIKYDYTNTKLLDDFHHVKYYHNVDDDHAKFAEIFHFFTQGNDAFCDIQKCEHVNVYYRDRSKLSNAYILTNNILSNHRFVFDTISRIHVYF
eukprot:443409_1